MASPCLEDLLAEEGFKGRKLKQRSRSSFGYEGMSVPLYLYKDRSQLNSTSSVKIRTTARTQSNVARRSVGSEFAKIERTNGRKPRDNLLRNVRSSKSSSQKSVEEYDSLGESDSGTRQDERTNGLLLVGDEIVEVEENDQTDARDKFKDIFSNEIFKKERRTSYSSGSGEKEKYRKRSSKCLLGQSTFSSNPRNTLPQPESFSKKTAETIQNDKTFENLRSRKQLGEPPVPQPKLDQVAIQATISILTSFVKRFLKDAEIRDALRQSCSSFLVLTKLEEGHRADNKVIENLEEAIETVERIVEEFGNAKDLKKASLQLSVITGLNSKDLKDGFTSGIPNSKLSACAHLYLSVIYKIQKKDKISAKHLLQVFCDSPFQARTKLLPELWDYLFLPHLSHLRVWYDQEMASLPDTSSQPRKLKYLEKVYNEILDIGTYQFGVYYKDWLTEGVEAPSIPTIAISSVSIQGLQKGASHGYSPEIASPLGSASSQPMISKKLYDSVFGRANKSDGVGETEAGEENKNFDNCRSSFGTVEEDKRAVAYSPEPDSGNSVEQSLQEHTTENKAGDVSLSISVDQVSKSSSSRTKKESLNGEAENVCSQRLSPRSAKLLNVLPPKEINELTLEKLAESIFQQSQRSNTSSHVEGQYSNDACLEEGSFFSSIPKDFVCPLTGELFEDPITLETGQTFERKTIKQWFDKGNRTCPITGRTLECLGMPITNIVLKRIIDSWKAEHCKNLLAAASQLAWSSIEQGSKSKEEKAIFILEQLLISFKTEERLMNAKHLISLGGLQFLILRFELGSLGEKARIVALLSCCIEADGDCRNYIAKNINKACVLELLQNKQVKSRKNVVILLTELIRLNRRADISSFLSSLQKDGIMNTMHVMLVHLQSLPPDERPLISALLLHFDLLVEPRKYSIYREVAVDSITVCLQCSLTDVKVRAQCCKALFILGGHFSLSGEVLIENWLLRQAGFSDGCDTDHLNNIENNSQVNETILNSLTEAMQFNQSTDFIQELQRLKKQISIPDVLLEVDSRKELYLIELKCNMNSGYKPIREGYSPCRAIREAQGLLEHKLCAEEEKAREDWWKDLTSSLLGTGKKSFLDSLSKCLGSGDPELVRTCLVTAAWMSKGLTLLSDAEFQLSAFSSLIPHLKESLESGTMIEYRVLASMILLNFSKISECRVLLMTIAEEVLIPLQSLAEATWTAKQLYEIISGERL